MDNYAGETTGINFAKLFLPANDDDDPRFEPDFYVRFDSWS